MTAEWMFSGAQKECDCHAPVIGNLNNVISGLLNKTFICAVCKI